MTDISEPGSTRQRLIEGAIELVANGGAEALTLRALGDHCGLSRGAPYRHFQDKDALVRAIAAAGFRDLTNRMGRVSGRGQSRLKGAMRAYIAWAIENPAWYVLTFQSRAATPAADVEDPELSVAAIGLLGDVTALVAEAQQAGSIPAGEAGPMVGVLWSTLHGAVDLALAGHAKEELDTASPQGIINRLLDVLHAAAKATSDHTTAVGP